MAAVILFGLILGLIIEVGLTSAIDVASLAESIFDNNFQQKNILAGKGGEEKLLPSENLITLNKTSLLAHYIPSPSPDLILKRKEKITYTVKIGDTLSSVAENFNVSLDTVLWENDLNKNSYIQPGQNLDILPISGLTHKVTNGQTVSTIAKKYNVDIDTIIAFNGLPADGFISIGNQLIIPGGTPSKPIPQRTNYYASNVSPQKLSSGYFIYPTSGRNWGRLHPVNAVDIANRCGTPIYAAAAGTVKIVDEVGWNRGYGKYMMITHPNGVETLYAHFTDIIASPGNYVNQGDLIGYMGTTGHSTGCHLHFEVRGATNPFVRY